MAVAHQPLAAIIGRLVGVPTKQGRDLSLDSLRQECSRTLAQHLGQRIGKISWLGELENISVGHGVSLLCWRSGGVEHPHDTPPYPFMPSLTSAHSSGRRHPRQRQRGGGSAPLSRRCRSRQASPNCRAQGSWATLIPVRFPLGPVEGAKLALLGALADSTQGGVRLLPASGGARGHQARDLLPMPGDYYPFALLDQVKQMAELVLRLEGADLAQSISLLKLA